MANQNQECSASISDILGEFNLFRIDDKVCECCCLNPVVEYDHLEIKKTSQSSYVKYGKSLNRSENMNREPIREVFIHLLPINGKEGSFSSIIDEYQADDGFKICLGFIVCGHPILLLFLLVVMRRKCRSLALKLYFPGNFRAVSRAIAQCLQISEFTDFATLHSDHGDHRILLRMSVVSTTKQWLIVINHKSG
jgi:hypothetical protein